jgi:2,3-bisphosphoglycerate-independent phosphoglycerate mutase
MLEPDGVSPHTAHTTNPVPLIVIDHGAELRKGGELKDLIPTALAYLGLTKPLQVSGQNLCK